MWKGVSSRVSRHPLYLIVGGGSFAPESKRSGVYRRRNLADLTKEKKVRRLLNGVVKLRIHWAVPSTIEQLMGGMNKFCV